MVIINKELKMSGEIVFILKEMIFIHVSMNPHIKIPNEILDK